MQEERERLKNGFITIFEVSEFIIDQFVAYHFILTY